MVPLYMVYKLKIVIFVVMLNNKKVIFPRQCPFFIGSASRGGPKKAPWISDDFSQMAASLKDGLLVVGVILPGILTADRRLLIWSLFCTKKPWNFLWFSRGKKQNHGCVWMFMTLTYPHSRWNENQFRHVLSYPETVELALLRFSAGWKSAIFVACLNAIMSSIPV